MWSDLQNPVLQVIPDLIRDLPAISHHSVPDLILPAPGLTRGDLAAIHDHPVPGLTRDLPANSTQPARGVAPPSASPQRAFGACLSISSKKKPGAVPGSEAP